MSCLKDKFDRYVNDGGVPEGGLAPAEPVPAGVDLDAFDALRKTYPEQMASSLVLPLLQTMQEAKGHLTESDAVFVADYLGVPAMQAVEVLSWYTMLYSEPVGRQVIKVCRNIACSLLGAERLIAHLEHKLGIKAGETTADGRFTLMLVECLASCGTAPAMQVNDTYHECLTEEKIDRILEELP
ncbi:MAG TPA: NADH-quinone oxidoreductase subunit NuoE [Geomonas sp.]|nr:NADH-quinone oxidoreductase subunit NuoE [Geomonas sp.]